jgi:uncharacterized protein (DUF1697 family)
MAVPVKQVRAMARFIALLRGINVGGHAKVPMAELRDLCVKLGWRDVRTYINSGNIVFESAEEAPVLEAALEKAIAGTFGFAPAVIVRSASRLKTLAAANPFPAASESEPGRVLLGLSKEAPKAGAAAAIQAKAAAGETVVEAGGALWFHYPGGAGTSKLTPALIDRAAGSPLTARNWRTISKLQEMLG